VVDAWMPGARCLRAQMDGGTLRGGAPRVVWQALGADPRLISAASAAERLAADRRPPHLVWNPLSGDFVQLIPVVRAACSLGGPEGLDYRTGGYGGCGHEAGTGAVPHPANREGRLCVQVGVVAWAWEPFTDTPLHGVDGLLSWLASWGVPARWPAGQPAPFRLARRGVRLCLIQCPHPCGDASRRALVTGTYALLPGTSFLHLFGIEQATTLASEPGASRRGSPGLRP